MKTSFLFALAFCCYFLSSLNANSDANEGDQLRKFLMSRASSRFLAHDLWEEFDTKLPHSPTHIGPQEGRKETDKIINLPGQPEGVDFNQYAGYVTVNEKNGTSLFYYFVESCDEPSSKPLLLWLNGGPGCSSFGYGAMTEIGPFRVNPDSNTLSRNSYAWNNESNVIFLQMPAGVGFTYSNTSSDMEVGGDKRTTVDAYTFLINWLKRFPSTRTAVSTSLERAMLDITYLTSPMQSFKTIKPQITRPSI